MNAALALVLEPTPERRAHDPVEPVEQAIANEEGRPSRPYQVVDALTRMERRGTITGAKGQIGGGWRGRTSIASSISLAWTPCAPCPCCASLAVARVISWSWG